MGFFIGIYKFLTSNLMEIIIGSSGILGFLMWKAVKTTLNPVAYISKLYNLADITIEKIDNNFIDKLRNKKVKKDIQKQLKTELLKRKTKIDNLIKLIKD